MITITADIDIAADPQTVWDIVTDFNKYSSWNPFIVEARGCAAKGERLDLTMKRGKGTMRFRPTVTITEPRKTLEWLGRLVFPGLFDGCHRFDLKAIPGGTNVVQSEKLTGLAVRFVKNLAADTTQSFVDLNTALKAFAEDAPR